MTLLWPRPLRGASLERLFLYSMTGGILRNSEGFFILTTGGLKELDHVRNVNTVSDDDGP